MATAPGFEQAVFSDARKADFRGRWLLFLFVLGVLLLSWWIVRDFVYHRLVYDLAQGMLNDLMGASAEKIGGISIDRQGDVTLHDAEAYAIDRGVRRLVFKAERIRLTLDGTPLRDERLRVMRVDLLRPEIHVRRQTYGRWNLQWLLDTGPRPEGAPEPPREERWKEYAGPDESFPRNGVHVHDGTVHVTFESKSGKEVTWKVTQVRGKIAKVDGVLLAKPWTGDFYGGKVKATAEIPKASPLTIRQLTLDIRDADVARMAEGVHFIPHPVKGRLNAVVALTVDPKMMDHRPVSAGRIEISDGDLWPLPAFSAILHVLTLTKAENRRIDSAVLEFTIEEERVRIDKMHFLGSPVCLFGDGACSLTGDWMQVDFIPRLGRNDWNSILPIIGAALDLVSKVVNGALVPVSLTGSFEKPVFKVGSEEYTPKEPVRQLIEEKSPR
jgi:hypothetical protein